VAAKLKLTDEPASQTLITAELGPKTIGETGVDSPDGQPARKDPPVVGDREEAVTAPTRKMS
jgi:hypothetical protein